MTKYIAIHKDTVIGSFDTEIEARAEIFSAAQKRGLEFWMATSQFGRVLYSFYYPNDDTNFDIYTIIKEKDA